MKRFLIISGTIVGVLILIVLIVPLFINVDSFRPDLEKKLSAALNRQVHIGKLEASLLSGGAQATDISISDDPAFNKSSFLKASSVKVGVHIMPLIFSKRLEVTSIAIQKPDIVLLKNPAGKWNYSSIGTSGPKEKQAEQSSSSPDVSVEKFEIEDGTIRIGNVTGRTAREQVYKNVSLQARNISMNSVIPFTMGASTPGGGHLDLEGNAGPLNHEDASKTPLDAHVALEHADLGATGFLDPSSGLGGTLDFEGKVKSDGKKLHSEGKAKANNLRVVKGGGPAKGPVSLDYTSDYALEPQTGTLNVNLHTGGSTATASGDVNTHGEDSIAHLKILGKNMAVNDVEGLLPAFGVVLPSGASLQGGNINMDMTAEGPLDRLVISGPLSISDTHLTGYNLSQKLGAIAAFTGIKASNDTLIHTCSSALQVAPQGLKANNILLDVPSIGQLTGAGVIASDNSLDFKMLLKLASGTGGMLGSLTGISTGAASKGIPFIIAGKTTDPVFRPVISANLLQGLAGNQGANQQGQQQNGLGGILGGLLNKKKKQ